MGASRISAMIEGRVRIVVLEARRVETEGWFLMMGPASRMSVWMGLVASMVGRFGLNSVGGRGLQWSVQVGGEPSWTCMVEYDEDGV